MVSLDIIEREISELETRETSYAVCERLAWLYIVRDNLKPKSGEPAMTESLGGSAFLELASNVPYDGLMKVLDEHMEALRVVIPKEYDSVMNKLRELH